MSAVVGSPWMSSDELLALPENGVERWLIGGRLWEKPRTKRDRWHSRSMARIAHLLETWLDQQAEPRGAVLVGEAGCRLRRNPDTAVGIDVVYMGPELAAQEPEDTRLVDGVPTLAVEILSPNDVNEEVDEKIAAYLDAGVPLVWIVDPRHRTVTVYRPGAEPEMFNVNHELSADPHLPGFAVPVARIFSR